MADALAPKSSGCAGRRARNHRGPSSLLGCALFLACCSHYQLALATDAELEEDCEFCDDSADSYVSVLQISAVSRRRQPVPIAAGRDMNSRGQLAPGKPAAKEKPDGNHGVEHAFSALSLNRSVSTESTSKNHHAAEESDAKVSPGRRLATLVTNASTNASAQAKHEPFFTAFLPVHAFNPAAVVALLIMMCFPGCCFLLMKYEQWTPTVYKGDSSSDAQEFPSDLLARRRY